MILIDTSVLINYLKGVSNEKTERFQQILEGGTAFGICSHIYLELLQGARDAGEFRRLQEYFGTQRFFELKYGRESFEAAAHLYFDCRKHGITIRSTIDTLIVQTCLEHDLALLHDDADFSRIASVVHRFKQL